MSELESKCIGSMGMMLAGCTVPLDNELQTRISRWAILKAMVNDTIYHERFYTREECVAFYKDVTFPFGIQVTTAYFNGSDQDANGYDVQLGRTLEEMEARGNVFVILVGHLILEVVAMHLKPDDAKKHVKFGSLPGRWQHSTHQLWPILQPSVDWPPALGYSQYREDVLNYAYFRARWKNPDGHTITVRTPKTPDEAE
jgi:hypothetical protein